MLCNLMSGDTVIKDVINEIPHYKESPLVQKAIADLEKILSGNREKEVAPEAEKQESEQTEKPSIVRLIFLAGFIRLNSSSALISMETDDFKIEGTKGNGIAADETIVDGKQLFLLQNDIDKDDVPYVVVSEDGKVVTDESRGFDETTLQKIRDFMCPPEKPVPVPEKPQMEQWQKEFSKSSIGRSKLKIER